MNQDIPATATEWVVRLSTQPMTDELQVELERWLEADPLHKADLAMARLSWMVASRLDRSEWARQTLNELTPERTVGRRLKARWLAAFGPRLRVLAPVAAFVAILVSVGVWTLSERATSGLPLLRNGDVTTTAINEISNYVLPDGSTLTVNADSTVRVSFTRDRRQVILERGEAFFEVQHDVERPFAVVAGAHTVTVTGTKFDVRYGERTTPVRVAVVEGHVRVGKDSSSATSKADVSVSAGDVIAFPEVGAAERLSLSADLAAAWRSRKLFFDRSTLSETLIEVNRYLPKRLVLSDAKLAELRISGAFGAGDSDSILFSLRELYNIEAVDNGDVWILKSAAVVGPVPQAAPVRK